LSGRPSLRSGLFGLRLLPFVQYWELKLAALEPGLHRIDVVAGSSPVWRTFFRLTE
jgi:hypothetical protein